MIQAIGLMVGAYIITRMLNLLIDRENLSIVTTIFAAITILVSIYCIYVLLTSGFEASELLRYLP